MSITISVYDLPSFLIPRILARSEVFQLSPGWCSRKGDEDRIDISICDAIARFIYKLSVLWVGSQCWD